MSFRFVSDSRKFANNWRIDWAVGFANGLEPLHNLFLWVSFREWEDIGRINDSLSSAADSTINFRLFQKMEYSQSLKL